MIIKLALILLSIVSLSVNSQELDRRFRIWETSALICETHGVRYPTKQTGDSNQPCDDGDMTLFNGLLCAAGDNRGCVGVAESQDPVSGLWHRSPRIRFLGKNDRGDADSSPDMALGIQLYLIKTKDVARAEKWLMWIHNNTPPCLIEIGHYCLVDGGLPKFCSSDNCVIRPQDYASLAVTVNYLQQNAGLKPLPDGRLRGMLGSFSGYDEIGKLIAANVNDLGFSQHLVGVDILALRLAGVDSQYLIDAANKLAERNPGNAFFSYLAGRGDAKVTDEVLARCTDEPKNLINPLFQWQWERSNSPNELGVFAWQQSSMWDCIFMAKLLGK